MGWVGMVAAGGGGGVIVDCEPMTKPVKLRRETDLGWEKPQISSKHDADREY